MNTYLIVRTVHIGCAIITAAGFTLRGAWMMLDSPLLQHRLAKILPHIVDTLLLLSAITLVVMSRQYPGVNWIGLKIFLLLAYILFGTFALKRGRTRRTRVACFAGALVCLAGIFASAMVRPVLI